MKELINKTIDILCINGECYANIIEEKEDTERTWYDKFYLWYRQNFTIIILIIGCLLVTSMIYYIWCKSNTVNNVQNGGKSLSGKVSGLGKGIKGKGKALLRNVKASPDRIGNAISNNVQSFYTLLFSIGIILGFGFFFMPTICMLIIGLLTYQITKNQVISLITR